MKFTHMRHHLVFCAGIGYILFRQEYFVLSVVNAAGEEQRMKTSEFEQLCDRLQLPTTARDFLLLLLRKERVVTGKRSVLVVVGT